MAELNYQGKKYVCPPQLGLTVEEFKKYFLGTNKLFKKHGYRLEAEEFVEESRSLSSPTHGLLNWDDTDAAHRYRLHQSRMWLCGVTYYENPDDAFPTRVWINVRATNLITEQEERMFVPVTQAMKEPDLREQELNRLRKQAKSFASRARQFEEFSKIVTAIDNL